MRRALLLCAVPALGLLGLLLAPQEAQAQRYGRMGGRDGGGYYGGGWGGYYGDGFGFNRGYYGNPYGWSSSYYYPSYSSSYYYPDNYGYTNYSNSNYYPVNSSYDNTMQNTGYYNEGQGQQDIVYDTSGQPWDIPGETSAENSKLIFLQVLVPAEARLWIDNQETKMRGTDRMFFSPPVTADKDYTYALKAQWTAPDGQQVTRTRNVTVRAGQVTPVTMLRAQQNVSQPSVQQPTGTQLNGQQPNNQQPNNQQPVYQQQIGTQQNFPQQPASSSVPSLPSAPK